MGQKSGQEYKNKFIMIKQIHLIILSLIFTIGCGQNKNNKQMIEQKQAPYNIIEEGDNTKFNYDNLSLEIINYGQNNLKNLNFKFPDYELFSKRILEVFSVDINKYNNTVIAMRISDFPEIVIKNKAYLLIQDSDSDNKYLITPEILYNYNKYIFYKDVTSLGVLKIKDKYLLKDLVVYYGYNEDKDLVNFIFKDFNFDNATTFHELIFGKKNDNDQYVLRKGIIDDIEKIIYKGKTKEIFSETKEGNGYNSLGEILDLMYKMPNTYFEVDKNIAFLCEKSLNVGNLGDVQNFVNNNKAFIKIMKSHNYYENERLKIFCENLEVINKVDNTNFIIYDSDGYTNLREGKSTSSKIIQRINSGEGVQVLDNIGDWWLIETKEGKQGYVYKSRVKN